MISLLFTGDKVVTMSGGTYGLQGGPGLTDPSLARQKHHHRKAFEYISKALRIDEDDGGAGNLRF